MDVFYSFNVFKEPKVKYYTDIMSWERNNLLKILKMKKSSGLEFQLAQFSLCGAVSTVLLNIP